MILQIHQTPWTLKLNIYIHYNKKLKAFIISHNHQYKTLMVSINFFSLKQTFAQIKE
jgi:hypothetical protein